MHFKLIAESCGWFGRKTLYGGELEDRPPQIYRLDYEFKTWPADALLEVNCQYIGTVALAESLKALEPKTTGVVFENVTTCTTLEFRENNPDKELPEYKWFKIVGTAGVHDFGMTQDNCLVVSERVLALMKPSLPHAQISIHIVSEVTGTPNP